MIPNLLFQIEKKKRSRTVGRNQRTNNIENDLFCYLLIYIFQKWREPRLSTETENVDQFKRVKFVLQFAIAVEYL